MNAPAPLPLAPVISGAFRIPWARRGRFLKGLAAPGAAIIGLQVAYWHFSPDWSDAAWASWLLWAVRAFLWVVFAVICHRIVLLDPPAAEIPAFPPWTWRETRFLGWAALACALAALATWAVILPVMTLLAAVLPREATRILGDLVPAAGMIVSTYVFARFALALPAAAIDAPVNLRQAWDLAHGNGLRMMLVAGALPWMLRYASGWLYRDESTLPEVALITALGTALVAVEVAALSLAYRELVNAPRATGE